MQRLLFPDIVLSGKVILLFPDSTKKFRTVRKNSGQLATLSPYVLAKFGEVGSTQPQGSPPKHRFCNSPEDRLNRDQQLELLEVLDRYPECFSDVPGYTDVFFSHHPLTDDFKPKRLHAYRIPEKLKPEVDRQIQEMLRNGIIRPSQSL